MEIRLCANEKCNNSVPPSKNKGITRIYCHRRCSAAVASRNYYARECGADGDGMLKEQNGQQYVSRRVAMTYQAAETRFKKHLRDCANSKDGQCTARLDPYDHRRECLIHAVLREDWDQLRRKARGEVWERECTTENGFWKPEEETKRLRNASQGLPTGP